MVDFYSIHDKEDFVDAVREVFPTEWQAIVLFSPKPKKETVEFAAYVKVEDIGLRLDFELSDEVIEDFNEDEDAWKSIVKIMYQQLLLDINDGILDRIRAGESV